MLVFGKKDHYFLEKASFCCVKNNMADSMKSMCAVCYQLN